LKKKLIAPVYNTDPYCLNENCGGNFSSEMIRKAGSMGGIIGGRKIHELKLGIHGFSKEEIINNAKKGGRVGSKVSNSIKWKCTDTGYTSTAGGLTCYQNKRGIDTSNRIKVDGPRSWEITFEDGRVIVINKSLKSWAEENGYKYYNLINVKTGKSLNHRGITKIVSF
jgi:hypothetical protein